MNNEPFPMRSKVLAMAFFRQVVVPFLILLVFGVALLAVSIRSFLPGDMAAPAPVETEMTSQVEQKATADASIAVESSDRLSADPTSEL